MTNDAEREGYNSRMPTIADVVEFLEDFAPTRLAEDWDNVGLLVGDRAGEAQRVMTCLTVTPASAAEAIREKVDLIVTHHPLPFHSLKRITSDTPEGKLLWDLIGARVSIYSPHTAFDSAAEGINQRLAQGLGLRQIAPLVPAAPDGDDKPLGAGRYGQLEQPAMLKDLAEQVKALLAIECLQYVGDPAHQVGHVAVACGSAGEFISRAVDIGCDCLVTGETRFHTCLEAEARGIALLLTGHYASERFAVEELAGVLAATFSDSTVWPSRDERDPLVLG